MYHIFFFNYSSADGRLGLFPCHGSCSAAVSIAMHVSFRIIALSRYMPRNGIIGSYGKSSFCFLRGLHSGCISIFKRGKLFSFLGGPHQLPQTSTRLIHNFAVHSPSIHSPIDSPSWAVLRLYRPGLFARLSLCCCVDYGNEHSQMGVCVRWIMCILFHLSLT